MTSRFSPKTFETLETHIPRRPYGEDASDGVPFGIADPFGLRRAVVPVFQRFPDGRTVGAGTAFHVDGWGRLLTADHVVDHIRTLHLGQVAPGAMLKVDVTKSSHAAVLLGYGLVFGTVTIPEECWAPIFKVDALLGEQNDDPFAAMRGHSTFPIGADIVGVEKFNPSLPEPIRVL